MTYQDEEDSPYKEELEQLITTLESDPDWNQRFGAASKLFRLGKEKAIDPLIKALQNDSHHEIKRFVIDLLGKLGDPRATWALIAGLRQGLIDKDPVITHHSKMALLNIKGGDLSTILLSTINDLEEFLEMRLTALQLLGKKSDSESVQNLIEIINNSQTDGRIRAAAIEQLVYTGNLAGLQLILELLDLTSNKTFQKVVVRSLGKTPFKNITIVYRIGESLLKIMENHESKKKDKDEEIIILCANALQQLAQNIGLEFNQFIDEILSIRKKQLEK